jgi:putative hydrolase of the HAD superfamily
MIRPRHNLHPQPVNILTFDLDGILINSDGLHDKAFIRALKAEGLNDTAQAYYELIAEKPLEAISTRRKLATLGAEAYYDVIKARKDEFFLETIDQIQMNPFLARDLANVVITHGVRNVGVVTNCTEQMAVLLLGRMGLLGKVQYIAAREGEATKPDPALYFRAADELGRQPGDHWLAFEDSDQGVAAAKAAGVTEVIKTDYQTIQERLRVCAL